MSRIFITGSKGFIGSHMVEALSGKHTIYEYDLVDNNDVRDVERLDRAIEAFGPDVIIHLAACAGVARGEDHPTTYFETNVMGTENVFRLARKYNVSRVISFSSSSALRPITVYGRTKKIGEQIAEAFKGQIAHITVIRPFTVFGLRGRGDLVIYKWKNQIESGRPITFYGSGNTYRPYTHITDLIQAVEKSLNFSGDFVILNISGKEPVFLEELLSIYKEKYGDFPVEYMPMPETDSPGSMPDNSNWETIGYKPNADFKEKLLEILNAKHNT